MPSEALFCPQTHQISNQGEGRGRVKSQWGIHRCFQNLLDLGNSRTWIHKHQISPYSEICKEDQSVQLKQRSGLDNKFALDNIPGHPASSGGHLYLCIRIENFNPLCRDEQIHFRQSLGVSLGALIKKKRLQDYRGSPAFFIKQQLHPATSNTMRWTLITLCNLLPQHRTPIHYCLFSKIHARTWPQREFLGPRSQHDDP